MEIVLDSFGLLSSFLDFVNANSSDSLDSILQIEAPITALKMALQNTSDDNLPASTLFHQLPNIVVPIKLILKINVDDYPIDLNELTSVLEQITKNHSTGMPIDVLIYHLPDIHKKIKPDTLKSLLSDSQNLGYVSYPYLLNQIGRNANLNKTIDSQKLFETLPGSKVMPMEHVFERYSNISIDKPALIYQLNSSNGQMSLKHILEYANDSKTNTSLLNLIRNRHNYRAEHVHDKMSYF